MRKRMFLLWMALPVVGLVAQEEDLPEPVKLEDARIREASGLAMHGGVLWTHNDSEDPAVYAVDPESGETRLRVELPTLENRDWEDMALLRMSDLGLPGPNYLIIGEIGDNNAIYKDYRLHLLPLPPALPKSPGDRDPAKALLERLPDQALGQSLPTQQVTESAEDARRRAEKAAEAASKRLPLPDGLAELLGGGSDPKFVPLTARFRYRDGKRDAEAMAFDPHSGQLLLLSKRDAPARLYAIDLAELELLPQEPGLDPSSLAPRQTAKFLGQMHFLPNASFKELRSGPPTFLYASQPTAMDVSPDGRRLAVLTYLAAYIFEKEGGEDWAETIRRQPQRLDMPRLPQAEGLCFSSDGAALYIISEGQPAPLVRLDLDPLDDDDDEEDDEEAKDESADADETKDAQ